MPTTKARSRGYVEQRATGRWRAVAYAGIDPITGRERRLRESAPTSGAARVVLDQRAGVLDLAVETDDRGLARPRNGCVSTPGCLPL